jgi:hypothetical protein
VKRDQHTLASTTVGNTDPDQSLIDLEDATPAPGPASNGDKPVTLKPFERRVMRRLQAGATLVSVLQYGKWHRGEDVTELRSEGGAIERMPNAAFRKLTSIGLLEMASFKNVRVGIQEQTFLLTAAGVAWLEVNPRKPGEIDPIYVSDIQLRNAPKAARKWLPLVPDGVQRIVKSRGGHGYLIVPIGALETKRYPYISSWVFSQIEPHLEIFNAHDGLTSWCISADGRAWMARNIRKRKVDTNTQKSSGA